jgi:hypothetical protein
MDVDEAIEEVDWVKTDYVRPHQYFVRDKHPGAFHVLSDVIRKRGVKGEFLGRQYRYFLFKGFRYWQMGAVIINRACEPALAA